MVESLVLTQATEAPPIPSTALACLVIVGRFYGVNLAVEALIEDHRLERAEITTDQLLMCAEAAGFRCTALHLKWATVLELKKALPAIVRFHDGRFAVLLGIDERAGKPQVVVQDPEAMDKPPVVMDRAAFEGRWDGDIILVKRSQETVAQPRPFGFHVIGDLILGQPGLVRDLAVSAVALSVLALTPILFAQMLISYVLAYPATATFIFLCCGVLVLILFEAGFVALRGSVVTRLAVRFEVDLSTFVFERLLNLPVDFFETTPRGLIAHRIDKIGAMQAALMGQMVGTALNVGILLLFVPVMMAYSVVLTFIFMGFLLIILGWARFMLPRVRAAAAAIEAAEAERSAFVTESLAGARAIKALSLDARQRHRWDVLTARVTRLRLAESDVANRLQTFVTPIDRVMVFGIFALGVYQAFDPANGLSLGMLFGYLLLMRRVAEPVQRLSSLIRQFDAFRSAAASLAILVNEPVEDGRSAHGVRLPLRGQIEFSNVRFEYKGALAPALQSISFDVPMGTTLGIMGRSGSGKTTITRLLQKLDSDYQGLIKIDGIDAREYDVDHLRRSLGVVLQDSFLFSGTIRDNIIAAKPDATVDDMAYAARLAGAEDFIDKLPLGYDTMIEEGSPNLSDGQRQRIAIARALIGNPQILIFDEATSALDAESEAIVNANLKRMASGRTMITISHRLSSLAHADAILVLDRGEVQDIGQHHELLERCDIYSGMWQRQNQQIEAPPSDPLLPRSSTLG